MPKLLRRRTGGSISKLPDGINNFNKLPDELVIHIISLLPFEEAVCTTILSTRWRNLFASISDLKFNIRKYRIDSYVRFVNVVDNLFRLRKRCLVNKFCLERVVSRDLQPLQVQRWIQNVAWHGIRELELSTPFTVVLPAILFTSKILEVLKLEAKSYSDNELKPSDARFDVPAEVNLPTLKVLHLLELTSADNDSLNRLVSNCPVLEELCCHLWENDCKLSVSSTTLKRLALQHWCSKTWSGSFDVEVNVPNIEFFRYTVRGVTSQTIVLGPSLATAYYESIRRFGDRTNYVLNATALLRSLSSIQTFYTSETILMNIRKYNIPLPEFGNLTRLIISDCSLGLKALPDLLARCGSLEVLEFKDVTAWYPDDAWSQLKESQASCLTTHLKTIRFVEFIPAEEQIEMVKYLLRAAKVLKSMEIYVSMVFDVDSMIFQELTMLPRVSEECKVFCLPHTPGIYQDVPC